jgi:DNA polymerase III subunit gamma/tau
MANFIVSARKYRPENFSAVIGQETITVTLRNAIKSGKIGHAYLFCGPRGVGKTTCARILAKTINCSNISKEAEACNKCDSCVTFNEMRSFNIHELDAASNNSVDDIRSITDRVRIPPQSGKYSIFIIDEVHMLSATAFNAFLKTLEEPPAHAVFILATTEKHKIIPTILSRCQIFDFNRIQVKDIVAHLEKIAANEGVGYELDALNIIALKADGAMRDALSIFDQMVSFSEKKITYQDVIRSLNVLDYDYYFKLTDMFLEANISGSLLVFNEILQKGFDGHNFIAGLSEHLRDLLVSRDPETLQLLEVGATIRDNYLKQSARTDEEFIYKALEICANTDINYRSSHNQKLLVELALVRLCQITGIKKKTTVTPQASSESQPIPEKEDQKTGIDNPEQLKSKTGESELPEEKVKSKEIETRISGEKKSTPGIPKKFTSGYSIKEAMSSNEKHDEEGELAYDVSDEEIPIVSDYFTDEELVAAWNDYAEKIKTDRPRMYNAMKGHPPVRKDDKSIEIVFDNVIQQDEFNENIRQDLLIYLKGKLNNELINLTSTVKVEAEKKARLYTSEEKFNYLVKKNPDLGKLKQEFNLDIE